MSTRTRQEYRDDLLDLVTFLEQGSVKELGAVRLSDLEDYQQALEDRGLTVSSRNRKTYSIKVFFRFLSEQEIIHLDLASRRLPPPVKRGQSRVLTAPEYHALQHACRQNARDAAVIELSL